jgi:hypothetical protein
MRNLCHWLVLPIAVLLPAHVHAESLTFRSEVTPNEFTATIGGDLSLPKGKVRFRRLSCCIHVGGWMTLSSRHFKLTRERC